MDSVNIRAIAVGILAALLLLLCVPRLSFALDAETTTSDGFVGLLLNDRQIDFYPVVLDDKEQPYIEVLSLLADQMGFQAECDPSTVQCQVNLSTRDAVFWLDGHNHSMGSSVDSADFPFDQAAVVVINGRVWVRFDVLTQWLPLETTWQVKDYTLQIITQFILPRERMAAAEQERIQAKERAADDRQFAGLPRLIPTEEFSWEGMGKFSMNAGSNAGDESLSTSVFFGADIEGGRFEAGSANAVSYWPEEADGYAGSSQNYWFYEKFGAFGEGSRLRAGDFRVDDTLLSDGFAASHGLSLQSNYEATGNGEFSLDDYVSPDSYVDVVVNGFYFGTVRADAVGHYSVSGIPAINGDLIQVKAIDRFGNESSRNFMVAGDPYAFLEGGDHAWAAQAGQLETGDTFSTAEMRYGAAPWLTTGLRAWRFDTPDGVDSMLVGSVAMRASPALSAKLDGDLLGDNWGAEVDTAWPENNWLRLSRRHVGEVSPLRLLSQNTDGQDISEASQRYFWGNWQIENNYLESELLTRREHFVRHRLERRATVYGGLRIEDPQSSLEAKRHGITAGLYSDFNGILSYTGEVVKDEENLESSHRLRISRETTFNAEEGRFLRPSTVDLYVSWHEQRGYSGAIIANWQGRGIFDTSLRVSEEAVQLSLVATLGVAGSSGESLRFQAEHEFGMGRVKGRLLTPGTGEPLPNVRIWVSNYVTVTDAEGRYELRGLPVYEDLPVYVDHSTLSVNMLPKYKQQKLWLRPNSTLVLNPELIWTLGVDGMVKMAGNPDRLRFTSVDNGSVVEGDVEGDGFFIIEKLVPGKHVVSVHGNDGWEESVTVIELKADTDWVSDLVITRGE